jgi:hypothetical protein
MHAPTRADLDWREEKWPVIQVMSTHAVAYCGLLSGTAIPHCLSAIVDFLDSQLVTNRQGGNWNRHHSKLVSVAKIVGVMYQCLLATNLCLRFRLRVTLLVSKRRILTCRLSAGLFAGRQGQGNWTGTTPSWSDFRGSCVPFVNASPLRIFASDIPYTPHSLSASKNSPLIRRRDARTNTG